MIHQLLESRVAEAVLKRLPDAAVAVIKVRPCPDTRFGDYQCNALMSLAKERKMNPRALATEVVAGLDVSEWCSAVEVAGAGFLNFRVKPEAFSAVLAQALAGKHLFVQPAAHPRTVVVDFSSPNVAKAMHVGHIRSTILGDCLSRTLRLLGHKVITDNHIGDWGTQFGKLIVGWKTMLDRAALDAAPLEEMGRIYKLINARFEAEEEVKTQSRQELLKLQQGDPENLAIWQEMIRLSRAEFDKLYARLGVSFDYTLGESFFNPQLESVVDSLSKSGIAQESEGAKVVFFEEIPELKGHPAIIQKSDGAANYATTDIATLEYRVNTWQPDEIVYVTDSRQQLHFSQFFAIYKKWKPAKTTRLSHVWFGMILGPDNKPFKTRTGENVKLKDLLDEAEERALAVVTEKNPDANEAERKEIARVVGLGSVKYADLLPNRQSDYVFSWDKMLALTGNTAPYLQYAYSRTRSILRKALEEDASIAAKIAGATPTLAHADEMALARHLLNFGLVLEGVAEEHRPNFLCNYLFELAGHYSRFFESCPVLKAEGNEKLSRLALCELTGRVLKQGLGVLGIETVERM